MVMIMFVLINIMDNIKDAHARVKEDASLITLMQIKILSVLLSAKSLSQI